MTTTTLRKSVTARLQDQLKDMLGPQRFALWLGQTAKLEYDETATTLRINVPHRFAAEGLERHCGEALQNTLAQEIGPHATYDIQIVAKTFERPTIGQPPAPKPQAARPTRPPTNHFRRKLEDFIVGPSNELAYAAAMRLADDHADPHALGHPLFIHGGCGLGKTHLLQGICQKLSHLLPNARVRYTTGESFTNEYIQAVRSNTLDKFRASIRGLDLLAVDDIHFLAAKEKTQQEFLHTFDQIDLGGARVVLASDCHPKLIKQFSDALVSRCVRGMVVQISNPDPLTRRKLVQTMALKRGITLSMPIADCIAQRCDGSVRDLEGLLTKLHAMTSLPNIGEQGTVTRSLVERLLEQDLPRTTPRRPVRFDAILDAVAEYFGLSEKKILGRGRHAHLVLARSSLVHLARKLTPMSYPEIAAQMGRRNHSTVITAAQRIAKQLAADDAVLLPGSEQATTLTQLITDIQRSIVN